MTYPLQNSVIKCCDYVTIYQHAFSVIKKVCIQKHYITTIAQNHLWFLLNILKPVMFTSVFTSFHSCPAHGCISAILRTVVWWNSVKSCWNQLYGLISGPAWNPTCSSILEVFSLSLPLSYLTFLAALINIMAKSPQE